MDNLEAARKILEVFKQNKKFLCLHDLAAQSGYKRVSNRAFKDGFNYLTKKGIIKLQQSGWSSERRGQKGCHPTTVILTANLYEVTDFDFQIDNDQEVHTVIDSCVISIPHFYEDFGSIPVQTPCGHTSLISYGEFKEWDKAKNPEAFLWRINEKTLALVRKYEKEQKP